MNIDDLNLATYLKDAIAKHGGIIRITLPDDSLIVINVSKQRITTKSYKKGSLSKVWRHTTSSYSELGKALMEIGYVIASSLGSVGQLVGFFKREPLQIEYLPRKEK